MTCQYHVKPSKLNCGRKVGGETECTRWFCCPPEAPWQAGIPYLWRKNPRHQQKLGADWLESSVAEKGLGIPVDMKLNMGQGCVLGTKKANGKLFSADQWKWPFPSAWHWEGHTWIVPWYKGDIVKRIQQRARKMMREREHLLYEERLTVVTVHPGGEKAQGYLIYVYKCLKWGCKDGARFLSVSPSAWTRVNRYKLETWSHKCQWVPTHEVAHMVVESPSICTWSWAICYRLPCCSRGVGQEVTSFSVICWQPELLHTSLLTPSIPTHCFFLAALTVLKSRDGAGLDLVSSR